MSDVAKAIMHFQAQRESYLTDLCNLVRIPSVSFTGFPAEEVVRSAEAVAAMLQARGLENVQILTLPGAHPYIYADWLHAPGKPTLLLYAHHDVQPFGRIALWQSEPFEPVERDGRLYGRGTADDKAGISVHAAAISSYLATEGSLPLNVKLIIEGEEEIGSTHLGEFVARYSDLLRADAMVLTDTDNFDVGVPGLTVSLRGIVVADIEVRGLDHSLHSGMWGGPTPDAAMALCRMLATLTDAEGRLAVPGMWEQVRPLTQVEEEALAALPYDEGKIREQMSVRRGVTLRPSLKGGVDVYRQLWREPSIAINAIEVASRRQAANIINDVAWARVGIRIVADMEPARTLKLLEDHLRSVTPWGVELIFQPEGSGKAWSTEPVGPAFTAVKRALTLGYGQPPLMTGCGGSIPFVEPLAEALGGIPALLVGVEDPYTNAHAENESLHLGDWAKAVISMIHFYHEFSLAPGA